MAFPDTALCLCDKKQILFSADKPETLSAKLLPCERKNKSRLTLKTQTAFRRIAALRQKKTNPTYVKNSDRFPQNCRLASKNEPHFPLTIQKRFLLNRCPVNKANPVSADNPETFPKNCRLASNKTKPTIQFRFAIENLCPAFSQQPNA